MELFFLFTLGLSTGLSGAMIPGPLTFYTISEAFRAGQVAGPKVALGHLLLEAAFAALALMGLRDFLSSAAFSAGVALVGGAALAAMGITILARLPRFSLAQAVRGDRSSAGVVFRWGPLAGGAFFSLISPGFLVWWAAIGAPVFLQAALAGLAGVGMVALGHAAADLLWCWLVAASVERGRAYCSDRLYRGLMAVMALCLIGFGLLSLVPSRLSPPP
jgi:threonine/homoserine/homoserine lactone efflux protein